jgi:hypothetical protein
MAVSKISIFASGLLPILLVCAGCTAEKSVPKLAKAASESTEAAAEPKVPVGNGIGTVARVSGGVRVSSTNAPVGGGYLVVYADGNGAPGERLGASSLLQGGVQKQPVTVKFPPTVARVWLVLHRNGDGNETLDFPGADTPMNDPASGGAMAEQIAELEK